MNDSSDVMDRRLDAAARRWQAEQPAPPPVPVDRLVEGPTRRAGWRAAVAAAAAVVLVGAGTAVVIRSTGGDRHGPSTTSGSPTAGPSSPRVHVVTAVVPWRPLPAGHPRYGRGGHRHWVTPYDGLVAGGVIKGTFHPGDVLRFTAYLESDTDVPLEPCPDYTISIGGHFARTWRLNCQQVPYRRASHLTPANTRPSKGVVTLHTGSWHPLLPARRSVHFAMQVTVPDEPGRQKVLWVLDGPESLPGFYGIIDIAKD